MDVAGLERSVILGRRDAAAAGSHRGVGAAMIGAGPADHLVAVRDALDLVVLLGDLEGDFVRLRTAVGEEHAGALVRRQARDLGGYPDGMGVRAGPGIGGDALHGLIDGVGDLLAAVTHGLQPHAGHHVEGLAAVDVGEPAPLTALVDPQRVGCLGEVVHLVEGQPQMVDRHLAQVFKFLGIGCRRHHSSSPIVRTSLLTEGVRRRARRLRVRVPPWRAGRRPAPPASRRT